MKELKDKDTIQYLLESVEFYNSSKYPFTMIELKKELIINTSISEQLAIDIIERRRRRKP